MKCSNMEELAAANSLIRPGTGGLDQYVEGKQHPETIRQIDERLAKPLRPTYGAKQFIKIMVPKRGNCWELA